MVIKLEQIVLCVAFKVSKIEQGWKDPIVTLFSSMVLMEIENECKKKYLGHCSVIYFSSNFMKTNIWKLYNDR